MTRATWKVAGLLFFSGACALVYQTVWLRQFRLIFGASTFATGAVLAIFMAGLGIGSALLGKRADARERPLLFYGNLEILIAVAAGLSPLLLWLASKAYFASGGSPELGLAGATLLRLVLATLILGPATLLMGGTLPAAARAVATSEDAGRHAVALLYGVNTLGAVAGALLSTFVLLEAFGNRTTLLIAVLVNLGVGVVARAIARSESTSLIGSIGPIGPMGPIRLVYFASAIAGFAFLLMELVWYRMLSPILGGTTYMFGLILAIALLGIGVGGAAYALIPRARATAGAFAITSSLEALAIAIPFALGDRLAVFANVLRDLGAFGFGGHVAAWTLVTLIVVFPGACAAGYQFPLLIALLGRGREHVGRQIGAAYAWNTAGAIAGSLAGGFGLLPLLSAPGTWRFVVVLLVALAMVAAAREKQFASLVIGAAAIACVFALGPTAVWRHTGIGAARAPQFDSRNELQAWVYDNRRSLVWEKDGRESSVAVDASNDLAFIVNGKSDGAARRDAQTQVMIGLLGALLHPQPRTSLVIGLGTGSTSGWLAQVPSMARVDTIELEPVVLDVARACAPVNAGAMRNPKVKITIADAREVLLTTDRTYDLIASEPSNPYRAGVASLFTREFYEAADRRLARGGVLLQWIQAYAMHAETMQTIYATLTGVFPHVQTWATSRSDLLLVASRDPIAIDVPTLRRRISEEPYRTALFNVWRAESAEEVLGRLVANEAYARRAAEEAPDVNTDDRTLIEFGFARSIDASAVVLEQIERESRALGLDRPIPVRGQARQHPIERDVLAARERLDQGRHDEAAALLHRAFVAYRSDPWPDWNVMEGAVSLAIRAGATAPERARLMHDALSRPFPVLLLEMQRRYALVNLAPRFDGCGPATLAALRAAEPNPYWTRELLRLRAGCYTRANLGDLAQTAQRDVARFDAAAPAPVTRPPVRREPRGSF